MQAEAGCQRGPHCLTARGPAANSDKGLTYTGLAAFMATDPLHVILGNIIDIYMKNTCAQSHKAAPMFRLSMGASLPDSRGGLLQNPASKGLTSATLSSNMSH